MENKNYEVLELDKILQMLSQLCSCVESKQAALCIQPQTDLQNVKNEIRKTCDSLNLSVKYSTPIFYKIENVEASLNKAASGGVLSIGELIQIKKILAQAYQLYIWHEQDDEKNSSLEYLFESIFPNKALWQRLENSILDEENLADEASSQLASIRRKITKAKLKIRETLDSMIKSSSTNKYLQESIITIRDGRFVLPVKTEFKGNINGLVHDTSASGSTLFIEPISVVEANNDIRILQGEEQEEIHRILTELSQQCAGVKEQIISSYKAAVKLDLYFSKANLAAKMKGCEPEISDDGIIVLNKARHPLIDDKKVVPINISLGETFSSLIITGPNTGGKTVALKTVGLFTLMTMCGLLIPVSDGSKVSIFKKILVDIGDKQSIEESLSTFSSHMKNVKDIINQADHESLVLIDELGSGTDPVEGSALAAAIVDHLRLCGAKLITTTHYQQLKIYAIDTPDVENACCEFDINTMKPTYKFTIGSPGKSNAFEISRSLGIDDEIIENAKKYISQDNKKFERIIDSLEQTRSQLEENNRLAQHYHTQAKQLTLQLEKQKDEINKLKEKEIEAAQKQAADIVNRVQRQSQALIDELDSIRKQKESENFSQKAIEARHMQKSAMNKLYLEANPITAQRDDDYMLPRPLKKGDNVIIADTQRKGIVVSTPDDKGVCFVQTGVMKIKVEEKKLRLVEKNQPQKNTANKNSSKSKVTAKGVESRMTRKFSTELDIRGYASDEGIHELDNFIDNAVISGITMLTIIHGRGTGVLKKAVRSHLKRHPSVKSFRPGVYGEGEDGVTIVCLK